MYYVGLISWCLLHNYPHHVHTIWFYIKKDTYNIMWAATWENWFSIRHKPSCAAIGKWLESLEEIGLYYLFSENKGADHLCSDRTDDLRLYFRVCKIPVFAWRGSYDDILFFKNLFSCRFVFAERPSKQFFSHVGTEPALPGYYQYFLGVNVSCSGTQHGPPSEDRTPTFRICYSVT